MCPYALSQAQSGYWSAEKLLNRCGRYIEVDMGDFGIIIICIEHLKLLYSCGKCESYHPSELMNRLRLTQTNIDLSQTKLRETQGIYR